MSSHALSVASASTIMIATSEPPSLVLTTRPATAMSNTAFSSWECLGNAIHWWEPFSWAMSAMRTPPTGPWKGSPDRVVDMDAALIATVL